MNAIPALGHSVIIQRLICAYMCKYHFSLNSSFLLPSAFTFLLFSYVNLLPMLFYFLFYK